jgi:hypothetical protein
MSQKIFFGYDQIIANNVGLSSLEFMIPQVYLIYHHSDSISPYMVAYQMQHMHFDYTYVLNVESFSSPTLYII